DFIHPQQYKKASEQQSEPTTETGNGVEQTNLKGKTIVFYDDEGLYPSSNQDGNSSSSDSASE
ncbi:hypothetical protein MKX01_002914, partial [Papaver californicum]